MSVKIYFDMDETLISSVIRSQKWEQGNWKEIKEVLGEPYVNVGQDFYYHVFFTSWFYEIKIMLKELKIDFGIMTYGQDNYARNIMSENPFCFNFEDVITHDDMFGSMTHPYFECLRNKPKGSVLFDLNQYNIEWTSKKYDKIFLFDNASEAHNDMKIRILKKACNEFEYVTAKDFEIDLICKKAHYKAKQEKKPFKKILKEKIKEVEQHNLNKVYQIIDKIQK